MTIYEEIQAERAAQDAKWGTSFDDTHNPYNWAAFIAQYATRHLTGDPAVVSMEAFRTDMLKVASLAVAAIGAIDRKNP